MARRSGPERALIPSPCLTQLGAKAASCGPLSKSAKECTSQPQRPLTSRPHCPLSGFQRTVSTASAQAPRTRTQCQTLMDGRLRRAPFRIMQTLFSKRSVASIQASSRRRRREPFDGCNGCTFRSAEPLFPRCCTTYVRRERRADAGRPVLSFCRGEGLLCGPALWACFVSLLCGPAPDLVSCPLPSRLCIGPSWLHCLDTLPPRPRRASSPPRQTNRGALPTHPSSFCSTPAKVQRRQGTWWRLRATSLLRKCETTSAPPATFAGGCVGSAPLARDGC